MLMDAASIHFHCLLNVFGICFLHYVNIFCSLRLICRYDIPTPYDFVMAGIFSVSDFT